MAHLGRPKGAPEDKYSLRPVADRLGELLGTDVALRDRHGGGVGAVDRRRRPRADGDVALLENVRFNAGETSKDEAERGAFADELAALGDAFVSDGFGVVHRKQASVYDVAQRLPHAMGGLVRAEIDVLRRLTEEPERPYVVVLGGSKVTDKLAVIDNLLGKADTLLIGGGMVFTFLDGRRATRSARACSRRTRSRPAGSYLQRSKDTGVEIVLPTDVVVAPEFKADAPPTDGRRSTRSPPTRSASTSAPTRARRSPRRSPARRRCSGTARWASSSSTPSPRAPARSPRR